MTQLCSTASIVSNFCWLLVLAIYIYIYIIDFHGANSWSKQAAIILVVVVLVAASRQKYDCFLPHTWLDNPKSQKNVYSSRTTSVF